MKPKRDKSFLQMAAFAGTGGLLAVGFSIGLPVWAWLHHQQATPAFFFFGIWGFLALAGAAANIHTYFQSGPPPDKPPRGGVPVREFSLIEGGRPPAVEAGEEQRAA
jgi:hypothetical protein